MLISIEVTLLMRTVLMHVDIMNAGTHLCMMGIYEREPLRTIGCACIGKPK